MEQPISPAPSPSNDPDNWDVVAPGYAEDAVALTLPHVREVLRQVPLSPADRVLDVATGPGTFALEAAPLVREVVAVDFSPGMIAELEARARRAGARNVAARVMDAAHLELEAESFDAAFCFFSFMFFPDRAGVFREMWRVVRPGGRVAIATWAPIERRPLMRLGFEALAEALPEAPPIAKGDLQVPEECVAEMTAAGFANVTARPFSASSRVDSAEEYVRVMERSIPFVILRKRVGEDQWPEVTRRLRDGVRKRLAPGGEELSVEAILTFGSR